ncbi:MAG: hypothetical protein JW888_08075 [Pirellulales bacterium]|nr:hypothetical protein [Pirellulales bacterium]
MLEMTLSELPEKHVVVLDDSHKKTMVDNRLFVLCDETETQPVITTRTPSIGK